MVARELAHPRLVPEGDDSSLGAGFEHRLDVLRRSPGNNA